VRFIIFLISIHIALGALSKTAWGAEGRYPSPVAKCRALLSGFAKGADISWKEYALETIEKTIGIFSNPNEADRLEHNQDALAYALSLLSRADVGRIASSSQQEQYELTEYLRGALPEWSTDIHLWAIVIPKDMTLYPPKGRLIRYERGTVVVIRLDFPYKAFPLIEGDSIMNLEDPKRLQ
jgi:hypothetical protein